MKELQIRRPNKKKYHCFYKQLFYCFEFKEIESLKDENLKLREEIKFLKEQNPLQNISNIIPVNSELKNKSILKEINNMPPFANQIKDEFQITEQIITNPQMFFNI